MRAGNKFPLDLGYVVGFSFSQFNDPKPAININDFKQTNMNLSAGLAVNLSIIRKLRLNAAYSFGLLGVSENFVRNDYYYGNQMVNGSFPIGASMSIDYGIDYDLSKNFSLGLSLSKIKYNDALNEIAFRSLRFSYFF